MLAAINNPSLLKTHSVIPGGAHTNSKGDDQFPLTAPLYIERGQGYRVWDEKGREFIDWTMGLRTMSLGYGNTEVIDAVIDQVRKGSNFGRPSIIETQTAEDLLSLIPQGEMVKFAKNGSTATTAAIKLARAYTGRDYIALCKDHPFFSYDDWFIGTTPCNSGIPKQISDLSLTFNYNDILSLEKLFTEYPGKIAAVILEAATIAHPTHNFLHKIKELCRKNGTVFILDEMITGFRWHLGGAQTYYNVEPDLSTFGKGMANGFALAALIGKKEIMELGGLYHNKRRVFLISTTHGAENHALAASRAVMKVFRENNIIPHLWNVGSQLIEGFSHLIREHDLQDFITFSGVNCSPYYTCKDKDGKISLSFRTLFLQEMARRSIIMNYICPGYAHNKEAIDITLSAAQEVLPIYTKALEEGIEKYLESPSIKPVFREYN